MGIEAIGDVSGDAGRVGILKKKDAKFASSKEGMAGGLGWMQSA
jgi:hypothetical protein